MPTASEAMRPQVVEKGIELMGGTGSRDMARQRAGGEQAAERRQARGACAATGA